MFGHGWGLVGGGMMGGWGLLVHLLFWIGLILLIVWVARAATGAGGTSTAQAILDQRYARGELTRKEYEQMKKDINS